jgi:hypothetical protein
MELISGQSAVRMPVQAMHHERFSKQFLQLFSVRSLHDNQILFTNKLQKIFRLDPCKFQKVYINRIAPIRTYIDEAP